MRIRSILSCEQTSCRNNGKAPTFLYIPHVNIIVLYSSNSVIEAFNALAREW